MDFVNPAKIKVKRTRIKPKIEYEKEIKLSLDKEQYELLLNQRSAVERQINFYFSYEGQTKNDTLRIRMVSKNLIVLTHKLHVGHQQEVRTSREKSVSLSITDTMEFIRSGIIPKEIMRRQLSINSDAHYLGAFYTLRNKIRIEDIGCDLDSCFYNGIRDYEVECEEQDNHKRFLSLMKKLNVTKVSEGKMKRFLMSRENNPMLKYKTIMFDLDGTLLETHHAIIPCFKKVCRLLNIDIEGRDLTEFIGPPLYDSFLSLTNSPASAQNATDLYRKLYDEDDMDTLIQPFDNMDKLLSALKKSGYKLGVTTSKHILKAKSCLIMNGIIDYFDFIAGSIPEKNIFRKCDVLRFAANEYGVDLNEAVLVGDTRFDMEGAEIMDIDCIGVTYGYGKFEDLIYYRNVAITDSVSDLGKLFGVDIDEE